MKPHFVRFAKSVMLVLLALQTALNAANVIQTSPSVIKYRAQGGEYEGASQHLHISFSPLNSSEDFSISKSESWIVLAGAPPGPACICDTWKIAVFPEAGWLARQTPGLYIGTITVTAPGYTSASTRSCPNCVWNPGDAASWALYQHPTQALLTNRITSLNSFLAT